MVSDRTALAKVGYSRKEIASVIRAALGLLPRTWTITSATRGRE